MQLGLPVDGKPDQQLVVQHRVDLVVGVAKNMFPVLSIKRALYHRERFLAVGHLEFAPAFLDRSGGGACIPGIRKNDMASVNLKMREFLFIELVRRTFVFSVRTEQDAIFVQHADCYRHLVAPWLPPRIHLLERSWSGEGRNWEGRS